MKHTLKKILRKVTAITLAATLTVSAITTAWASTKNTEPPPPYQIDAQTQGDWVGKYGSDGAYFFAYNSNSDLDKLPKYVTNFQAKANGRNGRWTFNSGENLEQGLPLTSNESGNRVNSVLYADESIELSFDIPEGKPRQIALYQAGDNNNRVNGIECFAKGTNEPLLPEKVLVDQFALGKYVVFKADRPCTIKINSENVLIGSGNNVNNAIVNAIFFDTLADDAVVEDLSIYPEDGQTTRFGCEPFQMKAAILPASASAAEITWGILPGSGESAKASIDNLGRVTVSEPGAFTVTAKAGDVNATCSLLVLDNQTPPEKTSLSQKDDFVILENAEVLFLFDTLHGTYSVYSQKDKRPYVLNAFTQINDARSNDGYRFACEDVTGRPVSDKDTSYESPKSQAPGKTIRLTGSKEGSIGVVLEVTLEDESGSLVLANGIVNTTGKELKLMQMYPLLAKSERGGGIFAGPDPKSHHNVMTGGGDWQTPEIYSGVNASTKNVATISYRDEAAKGLETFLLGGLTTYEFQNEVQVASPGPASIENNGRKSIDASIRVFDFTGKQVDAGQTYIADKTFLNFSEKNPYLALEDYGRKYADAMNVNLVTYNDYVSTCLWYVDWYLKGANNADYGVKQAEEMVKSGMANYAPPMIRLVPDTYSNPNEQLWWDNEHWKSFGHLTDNYPTLKAYGDGVRAAGGVPGMYMQPTFPSKDYISQHTDHMINNAYNEGPDYTDPGFIEHMKQVYTNMKEAGVFGTFYDYSYNYIKQDDRYQKPVANTNNLELTGGFEDKYATAVSAYRNIFKIAKDVYPEMAITENPWNSNGQSVAVGVIDAQRSVLDANHFDSRIARTGITQWFRNEVTKLVDPDVKVFDMENEDLRRAEITGTGLMFGKTMFGRPVEDYSKECIQDIGRIFPMPIDGVTARPVGLFDSGSKNPYLYDYMFNGAQDDHVLLLWNYDGAESKTITADFGKDTAYGGIGLDPQKEYDVWDFWDWRYIGRFRGDESLSLSVRPSEMKTLSVREVNETRILSTNRHVLQGEVDTQNVSYDAQSNTLTGTLNAVADDTYQAIVMLPDQTDTIKSFQTNLPAGSASAVKNSFGYVEITVNVTENTDITFTLELEKGTPTEDSEAPSVPWNLRAQESNGKPQLTWEESTDNSGFVEYRVYRANSAEEPILEENLIAVTNRLQLRDTLSLASNTLYVYQVVAVDAAGNTSSPALVKLVTPSEAVQNDGATGGQSWQSRYGADGQVFFNKLHDSKDEKNLPSYIEDVTYTAAGKWQFSRNDSSSFLFGGNRYQGCLFDSQKITLNITAKDNLPHSISLYSADGDGNGSRSHTIAAYSKSGEKIAEKAITQYQNGIYTSFNFTGSIRIELTKNSGPNTVLNAIFFDKERNTTPIEVLNTAPYAIRLSGGTVSAQAPAGTLVAALEAMDADQNDTLSFRLKEENAFFKVEENRLLTKGDLSGASAVELVDILVEDSRGGVYEKSFAIQIEAAGAVNKDALSELYAKNIGHVEINYTSLSWTSFQAAMTAAKAVLDTEKATQKEVDDAKTALQTAIDNLVNISTLSIVLDMAKSHVTNGDVDKLIPAAKAEFEKALAKAQGVYDNANATQEEVDASWKLLLYVIQALNFVPGDDAKLIELVAAAKAVELNGYEDGATKDAFTTALSEAEALLLDKNAMQADFDAAYEKLEKAMSALIPLPESGDKTQLGVVIETAEGYDLSKYVDDANKTNFSKVLAEAKDLYDNNDKATQGEIDAMRSKLLNAMNNLRLRADKETLNDWINALKGIDLNEYIAESASALRAVIAKAEALAAQDLGKDETALIQAMIAEMVSVKENLVKAEDPKDPDDSSKPEEPSDNSSTGKPSTDKTPTTGDAAPIAAIAALAVAALGTMLILLKKRRK